MDFDLPDELRAWQAQVRSVVREALTPHDDAIERTGVIPDGAVAAMRELGLYGLNTPRAYGGRGLSMLATCLALQELAKAHIAYYYLSGVNLHIGSRPLLFGGSEAQKQRWLPRLASGDVVAAFALTEQEAGSDAAALSTTARREGEHYRLDGTKRFITNAPVAGLFTVFAKTDPDARASGISAFLVEAGTPGLTIGPPTEMLGGHGSGHAELTFRDCRVPLASRIGGEGEGFPLAMRSLEAGRVCWAAYCVGAAERLLDLAVRHVATRRQFGRPLIANQGIEWQIADLHAAIHQARLVAYEAAWRYDQPGADRAASGAMAKLLNADMVFKVADAVLQLHGGAGYSKDLPVERIWREVRVVRILDGTSEIMRRIVARHAVSALSG